jgi:hypothetical protein
MDLRTFGCPDIATEISLPAWVLRGDGTAATLDIDFVNNRAWLNGASSAIASLLSVSRAGTATYTDSSGTVSSVSANTLRYGNNGLLIEESRTNLIQQSQFASGWTAYNTTSAINNVSAPDGTTTGLTLTESGAGSVGHGSFQTISGGTTSAVNYACSAYLQKGTRNFAALNFGSASVSQNFVTVCFDLNAGTVGETKLGTTSGTLASSSITALANGWYRCTIVAKATITDGQFGLYVAPAASGNTYDTGGTVTYVSGGLTINAWGAQVEGPSLAFPTSYIPTTSATVTRNADNIQFNTTPVPYSTFTTAAGTVYVEIATPGQTGTTPWYDNTADAFSIAGNGKWSTKDVGQSYPSASTVNDTVGGKIAAAYNSSKAESISVNGENAQTGTAVNAPAQYAALYLGSTDGSSNYIDTYLKRVAFWQIKVSNAGLATLTT